jgi:hypothetical protein
MPEIVVELFEVVDNEHHGRQCFSSPMQSVDLQLKSFQEHSMVIESRETIVLGQLLDFLEEAGFLDTGCQLM